ncbi:iron ABC transporter [Corynebacterium sp. 13CS0277]|uniref:FecCD family ABC transporter permease n=1 Tax=Corynebacterium sp. 13CS0277 TaxID=2071994 RepID=UPI000D02869D|nr:iron chelate uptake ABC transporter family permease subunit [Corynebacterium sp. 13CS0277]PRQ10957.1 iron ABC transporter [Corynebacterium sp. 13CS0277]
MIGATRVPGRPALRIGGISAVWRPRVLLVTLGLFLLAIALMALSIGLGDYPMSLGRVLHVALSGDGTRLEKLVVFQWRAPRALSGLVVGCALGMAGALTQQITRNSLASPDVLGITTGASAMAVTIIVLGSGGGLAGWLAGVGIPISALAGAILTATAVWLLARQRTMDAFRLVLAGIIISALGQAYINFLLITADVRDAQSAKFWLTGSLGSATWERTLPMAAVVLLVVPFAGWVAFSLLSMHLGPALAAALGHNVNRTQFTLLCTAVALSAVAVSAAGPIGFVAFVAPQLAARITGMATPPLLGSALTGAVLLLGADAVTQSLLPVELPVGLVTSGIGGAFLIYVLVTTSRKHTV